MNKTFWLIGDVREQLKELPNNSIHCCIFSPPYWGLRKYSDDSKMIGLEPTFAEWLNNMVTEFNRRIC